MYVVDFSFLYLFAIFFYLILSIVLPDILLQNMDGPIVSIANGSPILYLSG